MAKQQFNRRLSDKAIASINWWAKRDSTPARKVTDTEIVERAIAYYDEMRAQDLTTLSVSDPANVPGVQVEVAQGTGFVQCQHCGQDGRIHAKAGAWRACSECSSAGHGNFSECRQCVKDAHAKAVAAKSTSCEPDGIEFTDDWGA